MSRETEIADLLRKAGRAESQTEQREFVRQATELQNEGIEAKRAASEWRAEDAVIRDTLTPGRVHELHTAATDWLMELDTTFDPKVASQEMVAEASLWYGRVDDEVKSYGDEYNEQAMGIARRLAGQYGDSADVAERAFLDEAARLRSTAVRSGIVVEADANDPGEPESSATPSMNSDDASNATDDPMSTTSSRFPNSDDLWSHLAASGLPEVGLPTDVAFPATNGTLPPEATSSTRAPALQELDTPNPSQDVVPVNDPGLSQQADFPVSGSSQKESSMSSATCPTCGGHGRVAVRRAQATLPSIGDIAKFAASGLDQIDQIADAKDNPSAPGIAFPVDVAFPWTQNPAQQVPATISQAEQQIAERSSKSPLQPNNRQSVESVYHDATGRDNSGWIGDMGGRGTDYPGEQAPTGDSSSSDGYVDPVYGQGGDQGNQAVLPYGHQEADDTTNSPNQWTTGQPTQMDNGWREAVASNPNLASAIDYVNQHLSAYNRSGR